MRIKDLLNDRFFDLEMIRITAKLRCSTFDIPVLECRAESVDFEGNSYPSVGLW